MIRKEHILTLRKKLGSKFSMHKHFKNTRDLYPLNTILVRLYNAAASQVLRLRSAGSLAIIF